MTRIQQCYNCFPHSVQIKLQCNHTEAHCTGQRMSSFLSPFWDVGESGAWAWGETSPSLSPSAVSFTFWSSSLFLRGTTKSVFITGVPKKICRLRFLWVVWQMSNFSMDVAAAVGASQPWPQVRSWYVWWASLPSSKKRKKFLWVLCHY